ncbi:ABC transporter permease [Synoicihabitans lomoniglobus]|uniref:ABC transporter permease n=1 Tax=Synoicihabitans lomoniglobus TaxID=2909285 RepID=A0AAF0CRW0_9BACT|nr:ABC transporter permease [Opitutaceae bacterium LMO-M01]WED66903.1 ABC transporter permease [Opitutaceae bacterium LMO-M01]
MKKRRWIEQALTWPSFGWLVIFFAVPTVLVFALSFKPADLSGGAAPGWTLETWRSLNNPAYPGIVWRTLWLSGACTVVCLGLGVPVAYWIARLDVRWRQRVLLLIILPFWTNFLIRIFAWRTLLHPDGFVKSVCVSLGWAEPNTQLLYNNGAILLVLVYTYLPFAILPLYAATEKFDFTLFEAARDLGATKWRAFRSVFLPGIRTGLLTAFLIVFIPALGSYAIPAIVGGPTSEMIGNKIAQRATTDRNLPHAAALGAVLTLVIFVPLGVAAYLRRRDRLDVTTTPVDEPASP